MGDYYKLDGHTPVPVADHEEWARWFEHADRTVANTKVRGVEVSTVFLGLDHGSGLSKHPVLFETLIFGGKHHDDGERYYTWAEAEEGHARCVEMVEGVYGPLRKLVERVETSRREIP